MTKQIPLTQGKVALVDDDMYDYLNQWKWHVHWTGWHFYAMRTVRKSGKKFNIYMHHVVMNVQNGTKVDHRNNIETLKNTRDNLRICTSSQNMCNAKIRSDNTSGYKGVYLVNAGKYRAVITFKKKIHLGLFDDPEAAARAYDAKALELFGEFARTNF